MELREYIERWSQDTIDTMKTTDVIEAGRPHLFDFDYPIFDPNYKKVFETHFIRKFYMREIGFETEGLFKFNLENWMIINMPYFNKLFESELLSYNPLQNTILDTTKNKTADKKQTDARNGNQTTQTDGTNQTTLKGSSSKSSDGTETDDNFNRSLESDTPDSRLTITANDGQGVIEYASNIKEDNENNSRTVSNHASETENTTNNGSTSVNGSAITSDTLNSDINETEEYAEHVVGKIGDKSYPQLVKEFRESFIRIENRIFEEMQELFMLVY
jgi:hypothetical protein